MLENNNIENNQNNNDNNNINYYLKKWKNSLPISENIFFINLILLGFDLENEQKNQNILFYPEMFKKPNEKGMELIFYFLFQKLLGISQCKEVIYFYCCCI